MPDLRKYVTAGKLEERKRGSVFVARPSPRRDGDRTRAETVQNFAAHSIEGKEPITETMAEVLAKQGMPGRARIVYEKLSLLNPDKSAYFAAKIEQLNTH